ncbi:MAG: hypothetical protein KDI38_24200, partial [Calditrichaeota bacterium]|nr:hypothetical protein [Calditrichota bacterium]
HAPRSTLHAPRSTLHAPRSTLHAPRAKNARACMPGFFTLKKSNYSLYFKTHQLFIFKLFKPNTSKLA